MFLTETFVTARFLVERFLTERFLSECFLAKRFLLKQYIAKIVYGRKCLLTGNVVWKRSVKKHSVRKRFIGVPCSRKLNLLQLQNIFNNSKVNA